LNQWTKLNGIKDYRFTSWANTYTCDPLVYFEPTCVEQLKEIVELAAKNEKRIKVVGCGHSYRGIQASNDYMISMKCMNSILEVKLNKFLPFKVICLLQLMTKTVFF
jgi:FAD/FMN-containing dehydrogenase